MEVLAFLLAGSSSSSLLSIAVKLITNLGDYFRFLGALCLFGKSGSMSFFDSFDSQSGTFAAACGKVGVVG